MGDQSIEGLRQPAPALDDGSFGSRPSPFGRVLSANLAWAWITLLLGVPLIAEGLFGSLAPVWQIAAIVGGVLVIGVGVGVIVSSVLSYSEIQDEALEADLGLLRPP